jgi:hypothetical protein
MQKRFIFYNCRIELLFQQIPKTYADAKSNH